jgi:hypothetical protein
MNIEKAARHEVCSIFVKFETPNKDPFEKVQFEVYESDLRLEFVRYEYGRDRSEFHI